jgi:integrase
MMPTKSRTGHVRKICGCATWKTCRHPWFVSYRQGTELGPDGTRRPRRLRRKLADLVGREPMDYADAQREARRAILAWQEGRDARRLQATDWPTLAALLDAYRQRPNGSRIDPYQCGPIVKTLVHDRPFGDWRAADVTREMIEAFQRQRPAVAGNRDLKLLSALFNWAVREGLVPATPFKIGTVTVVKLAREEPRSRRLQPGEEERLLLHARGGLRDLIIAALESGCRTGELLSLQWDQVLRDELFFPGGKTKAKKPRRVPLSTVLRAVLVTPSPPPRLSLGTKLDGADGLLKQHGG